MKLLRKFITIMTSITSMVILTLCKPLPVMAAPEDVTPNGWTLEELERYSDTYFGEMVQDEIPGASIAVVSNGQIVFEKGYGYSDIERNKMSNPQETVYEYGSVSKLFTWISLMKLKEEGKIDLGADIREYLPKDFELPLSYDKPITALDLMNHQAGFDDYFIHLFSKPDEIGSLREALEENKVQQIYEPGFASSYSNYGAALAGYIVENVTGMPDYEYVQNYLFRPIGMENTVLCPDISGMTDLLQNKAKVYEKSGNGFQEENWTYVPMYPAGSANGTVDELAHFAMALLDEKGHPLFEKEETGRELFTTSTVGASDVAGIAHGFIEYQGKAKSYWHTGGTDHSSTFFAVVPELDFGIAICTNTSSDSAVQDFGFGILQAEEAGLQQPQENLPSTSEVEGYYMDFREAHRGISKLVALPNYLFATRVKALNEEQILADGSTYRQIEPYIYQDIESGDKIAFSLAEGKVEKYTFMMDYVFVPRSKILMAWGKAILLGLFILTLPIMLGYLIILLVKKKLFPFHLLIAGNLAGVIALGLNYLTIISKVMEWEKFEALRFNLILGAGIGFLLLLNNLVGFLGFLRSKNRRNHGKVMNCLIAVHFIGALLAIGTLATMGGFSIIY